MKKLQVKFKDKDWMDARIAIEDNWGEIVILPVGPHNPRLLENIRAIDQDGCTHEHDTKKCQDCFSIDFNAFQSGWEASKNSPQPEMGIMKKHWVDVQGQWDRVANKPEIEELGNLWGFGSSPEEKIEILAGKINEIIRYLNKLKEL